jgi:hypothetical protein
MITEIVWILFMLGAITAVIVAAVRENKARAKAVKALQPTSVDPAASAGAGDGFGFDEMAESEFNVDSLN